MKSMKVFGICLLSALTLAGCGGSSKGGQPAPYNPYMNGQYNNMPTAQPYTCTAGMIQLRNAFGQPQCFQTTNIADACAQVGGMITQNSLCRKERQIQGSARGKFRNNGAMAPDNIPLRVNLFSGEGVKIYGTVDSLTGDQVQWNAQLIQNNMVLVSTSGDTTRTADMANLSMTSISTASSAQYAQPGVYNQQYNPQYPNQYSNQYPNQYPNTYPNMYPNTYQSPYQTPYMPTQYPNAYGGVYAQAFYNQPAQATPNLLILQLMFEGKVKVELHASAISCEDGKGNSYPCQ